MWEDVDCETLFATRGSLATETFSKFNNGTSIIRVHIAGSAFLPTGVIGEIEKDNSVPTRSSGEPWSTDQPVAID